MLVYSNRLVGLSLKMKQELINNGTFLPQQILLNFQKSTKPHLPQLSHSENNSMSLWLFQAAHRCECSQLIFRDNKNCRTFSSHTTSLLHWLAQLLVACSYIEIGVKFWSCCNQTAQHVQCACITFQTCQQCSFSIHVQSFSLMISFFS